MPPPPVVFTYPWSAAKGGDMLDLPGIHAARGSAYLGVNVIRAQ